MKISELEHLWSKALNDILGEEIESTELHILARQTEDSIRRIEIYDSYRLKAEKATESQAPFTHTSNPLVLAQRSDLSLNNRVWVLYLATYFGKSDKSNWELFKRASFREDKSLIGFKEIQSDPNAFFDYLSSIDFFNGCDYSNHRKFTAKHLDGPKGVFRSMKYVIENINVYSQGKIFEFEDMNKLALKIPNFGRLAAFDFTSTLVKCYCNVNEPKSMYAEDSSGPLNGLRLILKKTNNETSVKAQIQLSYDLMEWFSKNSSIFMLGQVLEDAVCNWQKNTIVYKRYTG